MNLYFLLEDSKSFFKVLPQWINFVLPNYNEVIKWESFEKNSNNFFVESGNGYPQIKKYLNATLEKLYKNDFPVDYIILCWDTDAKSDSTIMTEKNEYEQIFLQNVVACQYRLFPINRCFETWLLGNRAAYPQEINEQFAPYNDFFNVTTNDPEEMLEPGNQCERVSRYHYRYLQEMLRGQANYSKKNPGFVATNNYFNELQSRITDTDDLRSFAKFIKFLTDCRASGYFPC